MRHILCNYGRDRSAAKRGGGREDLPLEKGENAAAAEDPQDDRLLALDEALTRLEGLHPRPAQVVECRFFGGLTVEETAAALDVSVRTVKRDWSFAQTWLHAALADGHDG